MRPGWDRAAPPHAPTRRREGRGAPGQRAGIWKQPSVQSLLSRQTAQAGGGGGQAAGPRRGLRLLLTPVLSPSSLGLTHQLVYHRHTPASVALASHQFPGWRVGAHKPPFVPGGLGGRGRCGKRGGPWLTLWNGCAICLRKYLATWTPSSTVRLRLASVRCSWIQRGSFPRLSARANRCERRREGRGQDPAGLGYPAAARPIGTARRGEQPAGRAAPPHLVGEDHEAVVRLAPDGPAHALGCVAHGVEGEEVVLSDLELVPQVLQPRLGEGKGGGRWGPHACPWASAPAPCPSWGSTQRP